MKTNGRHFQRQKVIILLFTTIWKTSLKRILYLFILIIKEFGLSKKEKKRNALCCSDITCQTFNSGFLFSKKKKPVVVKLGTYVIVVTAFQEYAWISIFKSLS